LNASEKGKGIVNPSLMYHVVNVTAHYVLGRTESGDNVKFTQKMCTNPETITCPVAGLGAHTAPAIDLDLFIQDYITGRDNPAIIATRTCDCLEPDVLQPNIDLLKLYSIIMADVETTHPPMAISDAIVDDGEEAESKARHSAART